jgi:Tfp pilus assembly protein PilZ
VAGRDGARRVEYALNVSASGLALHVERLPPVGEALVLAFALPDGGGRLVVRGRIAWHEAVARTERPRFRELGVRFEALGDEERRRLARFAAEGAGAAEPCRPTPCVPPGTG